MKRIEVELTGDSPMLHHRFTEAEFFNLLGLNKTKKKLEKEYRTPREIADQYVYQNKKGYYIPATYITTAFRETAADYKQTNSRRSIKAIAAGVFRAEDMEITLLHPKTSKPLTKYEVELRKATNHQRGAVATCRPRFDEWKIRTTFELEDDLLSPETAQLILNDAGRRCGVGSFRISKGGPFGRFRVTLFKEIIEEGKKAKKTTGPSNISPQVENKTE